jgi:protein-tyrosine kinase
MTIAFRSTPSDSVNAMEIGAKPLPGIESVQPIEPENAGPQLVALESKDARSRPFNLLRAQLIKTLSQSGGKLVGITSAAPGTGKSFILSNLAASLGQLSNRRTFLIDLDLRRASIAHIFGIRQPAGLTEYLIGEDVVLENIGRRIGTSNLVVYPSFPAPVSSAELMVGDRFVSLIARARALDENAIVLVDLPPAFANDDAMLVAESLDGVLVVVEQGVTTKKQLESVLRIIQPTPLLGTVFNRYDGGLGDPYGYGGKYSGYYSE